MAAALRVTWWGFGTNVGLAGLKGIAGALAGSSALIADAAHSLSDLISDFVTLFVVSYARRPPDESHPYGRGRFEALGSLAVATVLVGTASGVGWSALGSLVECWQHGGMENEMLASGYGGLAISACVLSLVAKEALYHATLRVGRQIDSQTVVANAWHHRSDALSSVAALVGVGGSLAGVPVLDPLSGLVVSAMVAKAGVEIGWESAMEVTERAEPDDETLVAVQQIAAATDGVLGVRRLRSRRMGPYSLVDLHADVDPTISVSAAHHVAARLRRNIMMSERHVSDVLIHIEPQMFNEVDHSMPPHTTMEQRARDALAQHPGILGVSQVIVHYTMAGVHLKVDIICDFDLTIKRVGDIAQEAKKALEQIRHVVHADVDLELPPYNDPQDFSSLSSSADLPRAG